MQAYVDKRSISGEKYALTRSTRRIPRALGSVTAAKNEVLANQLLLLEEICFSRSCYRSTPFSERNHRQIMAVLSTYEMPHEIKQIIACGVCGDKSLSLTCFVGSA